MTTPTPSSSSSQCAACTWLSALAAGTAAGFLLSRYFTSSSSSSSSSSASSCCAASSSPSSPSSPQERDTSRWDVPISAAAERTFNPIRAIVDELERPEENGVPIIPLSIGDPTVFHNLPTADAGFDAVIEAVKSQQFNGYPPSTGLVSAREAVAKRYSVPGNELTADDVVIASGCSGAIEIAIPGMVGEGENILVPSPGFSLYVTVAQHRGIECRYYPLQPDKQWEVDLDACEALVDANTRAIVITNPSNPCGSNFSEAHLRDIVAFAERMKLPILADEIYANMVFSGQKFTPIASVSGNVPVLSMGGLAKQYLVPGWRVGWVCVYDPAKVLGNVRRALLSLSQIVLGANSLVQAAVPAMLERVDDEYYGKLNAQLEDQAMHIAGLVDKIPGLQTIRPQGAMYVMVRIDLDRFPDIEDDFDFSQKLLTEQHVFVLPGKCFRAPGFFRIVFCAPKAMLSEAAERMHAFVAAHME